MMRSKTRFFILIIVILLATTAFRPFNAEINDQTSIIGSGQLIESIQDWWSDINWTPSLSLNQVEAPEEPMEWKPTFNLPQPSEFTGSASYSFPFMVPPGVNGLQPALGIGYNSSISNFNTAKVQSNPEGWGWNLSGMIEVTQDLKICNHNDIDKGCVNTYEDFYKENGIRYFRPTFNLVINGTGYDLIHEEGRKKNGTLGRYLPQGSNSLYVEFCSSDSPTTKCNRLSNPSEATNKKTPYYWIAITPNNSVYRIGYTENSEQSLKEGRHFGLADYTKTDFDVAESVPDSELDNARNPIIPVLRWRVDLVEDQFSNQINYRYKEPDNSADVKVVSEISYPLWIRYNSVNGKQAEIKFVFTDEPEDSAAKPAPLPGKITPSVLTFHTEQLTEVIVELDGKQLRKYQLGFNNSEYGYKKVGEDNNGNDIYEPEIPASSGYSTDIPARQQNVCQTSGTHTDSLAMNGWHAKLLTSIVELGPNSEYKVQGTPDVEFTYIFRKTGEGKYNHDKDEDGNLEDSSDPVIDEVDIPYSICRPYMRTAKVLYNGTGRDDIPSIRFDWEPTEQVNSNTPKTNYKLGNRIHTQINYSGFEQSFSDPSLNNPDTPGQKVTFKFEGTYTDPSDGITDKWGDKAVFTRSKSTPGSNNPADVFVGYHRVTTRIQDFADNTLSENVNFYHAFGIECFSIDPDKTCVELGGSTESNTHPNQPFNGRVYRSEGYTYLGGPSLVTRKKLSSSETVWGTIGAGNQVVSLATQSRDFTAPDSNLGAVTYNLYDETFGSLGRSYTWINNSSKFENEPSKDVLPHETNNNLLASYTDYNWNPNPIDNTIDQKQHTRHANNTSGDIWLVGLPVRSLNWSKSTDGSDLNSLVLVSDAITRYDDDGCGSELWFDSNNDTKKEFTYKAPEKGLVTASLVRNMKGDGTIVPLVDTKDTCAAEGVDTRGEYIKTDIRYDGDKPWQIASTNDPRNVDTTYQWNEDGIRLDSITSSGLTTEYGYDATYPWQVQTIKGANQAEMTYEYDVWGRLEYAKNTSDPNNIYVTQAIAYADPENPFNVTVTAFPGSGDISAVTRTYYDGFGRPFASSSNPSGGEASHQFTGYDALGRTTCQSDVQSGLLGVLNGANLSSLPNCASTQNSTFLQHEIYRGSLDVNGQSFGAVTGYSKTLLPNQTELIQFTQGLKSFSIDALDRLTIHESDKYGRLAVVTEPAPAAGSTPPETEYFYNAGGFLTAVENDVGITSLMTYDMLGHKLTMNDPDMGAWEYVYDVNGNLRGQKDGNGDGLCFMYDALNRMTDKWGNNHADANTAVDIYAFDATCSFNGRASLAKYKYDAGTGNLIEVNWPGYSGTDKDGFIYDGQGRLENHTRTINQIDYTMKYENYNRANMAKNITYPDGETIFVEYDSFGADALTEIGRDGIAQPAELLVTAIDHNFRGQITRIDRMENNGGADTVYDYYATNGTDGNSLNRLESISHQGDGLSSYGYTYDLIGNIDGINEMIGTNSQTQSFGYDGLNRLTSASANQASFSDLYSRGYAYDSIGNLTQLGDKVYEYNDPKPHAVTAITVNGVQTGKFTYDNNGNMTSRLDATGHYTQTFDIENRLIEVINRDTKELISEFHYDASGQRTMTIEPQADGSQVITYFPFPEYEEIHTITDVDVNNPPVIQPIADQSNTVGDTVSLLVSATDPDGDALTFTVEGLPAGLSFDSNSLTITGSPTTVATQEVTITVEDTKGGIATELFDWAIIAQAAPPTLANPGDQTAVAGEPITLVALNVTDPDSTTFSFNATGLPVGLSLNSTAGQISGTPTTAGVYPVTVTVTDDQGLQDSQTFSWTVIPGHCISINNAGFEDDLTDWYQNSPVDATIVGDAHQGNKAVRISNGWIGQNLAIKPGATTLTLTGHYKTIDSTKNYYELGLDFLDGPGGDQTELIKPVSSTDGYTAFTVVANVPAGYQTVRVWAYASGASQIQIDSLVLTANDCDGTAPNIPPTINDPGDQTTEVNTPVSLQIDADDIDGDPLTYSATGLPTGVSINSNSGLISGTPDTLGINSVTVTVSDGKDSATVTFSWSVEDSSSSCDVLSNGGFENGLTGWVPVNGASASVVSTAHEGSNAAEIDGGPDDDDGGGWLGQTKPAIEGNSYHFSGYYQTQSTGFFQAGLDYYNDDQLVSTTPLNLTDSTDGYASFNIAGVVPSGANKIEAWVYAGAGNVILADGLKLETSDCSNPNNAPSVVTPADQTTDINTAVTLQIDAIDSDGDSLTYTASGLPAGLVINSVNGLISGTPSTAGSNAVIVYVTDGTDTTPVSFGWTIIAKPELSGLIIYDDNLRAGWNAGWWSSNTVSNYDLDATDKKAVGQNSLYATIRKDYATLNLENEGEKVHGDDFEKLRFWMHSDNLLKISLRDRKSSDTGGDRQTSKVDIEGALIVESREIGGDTWQLIEISLKDDGNAQTEDFNLPNGYEIDMILIQGQNTTHAQPTFYLDQIELIGSGGSNPQPPVITNPGDQTNQVGDNITLTIYAYDPDGTAVTFSETGLPSDVQIDPQSGVISGTPDSAGSSNVTITAEDADGQTTSVQFSWTITDPAPTPVTPEPTRLTPEPTPVTPEPTPVTPEPTIVPLNVSLSSSDYDVTIGQQFDLTWTSSGASSCKASWASTVNKNGTRQVDSSNFDEGSRSYWVECDNSDNSPKRSAIQVRFTYPDGPVVSLNSNKASVIRGETFNLSWSSSNATSCSATWTSKTTTSGTESIDSFGYPAGTHRFDITCKDQFNRQASASTTVSVALPPKPTVTLTGPQGPLTIGDPLTLNWTSTRATSCSATWTNKTTTSGSQALGTTGYSAGTRTYTITCKDDFDQRATVDKLISFVNSPSLSLSSNKSVVTKGDVYKLTWNSSNATSCKASWATPVTLSGSKSISSSSFNPGTVSHWVECSNAAGKKIRKYVSIDVVNPPAVTLTSNKGTVEVGEIYKLTWNSTGATSCKSSWASSVTRSGNRDVTGQSSDPSTVNHWVECQNVTGRTVRANASVNVVKPQTIGFVGGVSVSHNDGDNEDWTYVSIPSSYGITDPVVIAKPASTNNSDVAVVRIRIKDDSSGFWLMVQDEPGAPTTTAVTEVVHYMVMQRGVWKFDAGGGTTVTVEANYTDMNHSVWSVNNPNSGSATGTASFNPITFSQPFASTPVIISQIQSFEGKAFTMTRQQGASRTGFELAMQEFDNSPDPMHNEETVGWIAISQVDQAGKKWNSISFEAGRMVLPKHPTGPIDDDRRWIALDGSDTADANDGLNNSYGNYYRLIAGVSTFAGNNSTHLRRQGTNSTNLEVKLEEDTTVTDTTDPTHSHDYPETIDYIIFNSNVVLEGYLVQQLSAHGLNQNGANAVSGYAVPVGYSKAGGEVSLAPSELEFGPQLAPAQQTPHIQVTVRKTYLAGGTPIAQRSYERDGAVAIDDPAGRINQQRHFIYTDHLGSASTVVNGADEKVEQAVRFLPFGEMRDGADQLGVTNRGFTGHRENREIGLTYMNARFYLPGIGRFAAADTIVPDSKNPQSFNRFTYVGNNPIKLIDPSGHDPEPNWFCLPEDYDATCGGPSEDWWGWSLIYKFLDRNENELMGLQDDGVPRYASYLQNQYSHISAQMYGDIRTIVGSAYTEKEVYEIAHAVHLYINDPDQLLQIALSGEWNENKYALGLNRFANHSQGFEGTDLITDYVYFRYGQETADFTDAMIHLLPFDVHFNNKEAEHLNGIYVSHLDRSLKVDKMAQQPKRNITYLTWERVINEQSTWRYPGPDHRPSKDAYNVNVD